MKSRGFTIVELLIVIVVIGILAAIAIIAYSGIQQRAQASNAQGGLDQATRKLALYLVDNGTYPADSTAFNTLIGSSGNTTYQYTANNATNPPTYCVTATSGTTSYKADSTNTTPASGGCAGHGVGGVGAVTNLATNPGIEGADVSVYGCNTCTPLRDNSWSESGSYSISSTPSLAGNDTFITIGGDLGGFRAGLQAGKTYTISATIRLTAALTGTLAGNGSRQITAWYTNGGHTLVKGSQAPNAAGQQRVSVTYSIPVTATAAWVRLYNGASVGNGVVWWDNIMITESSTLLSYADGSSTNWVWNGTPNSSTSTGPSL